VEGADCVLAVEAGGGDEGGAGVGHGSEASDLV
jgi:hypothetical protein